MNVHDYDDQYKVYYSAQDRIVKQLSDHIYETYHITVIENKKVITINTVNFTELTESDINKLLNVSGLKYISDDNKIVQKHDTSKVIEDDTIKIAYVLADRLSISGLINDAVTYNFEKRSELNELLLEHDIPIRFSRSILDTL